mgnify:CR=1 FL=1
MLISKLGFLVLRLVGRLNIKRKAKIKGKEILSFTWRWINCRVDLGLKWVFFWWVGYGEFDRWWFG